MNRRRFLGLAGAGLALSGSRVLAADGLGAALEAVGDARYIAIGERHDNPEHHRLQAALVAALQPDGLAFEMITHEQENKVNALRAEGAPVAEIGPAIGWEKTGWPDWSLYAPILEASPGARVTGGALSKDQLGAIYKDGASGLGPEMTEKYRLGSALPAETEDEMLEEQYKAHCGLIEREKLGRMVAVQRAWDAAFAEAWLRAGGDGAGRSVLICGNVHARLDRGAPASLLRAMPGAGVASIGLLETGDQQPDAGAYTATLVASRPEREDPCERMRAAIKKG